MMTNKWILTLFISILIGSLKAFIELVIDPYPGDPLVISSFIGLSTGLIVGIIEQRIVFGIIMFLFAQEVIAVLALALFYKTTNIFGISADTNLVNWATVYTIVFSAFYIPTYLVSRFIRLKLKAKQGV